MEMEWQQCCFSSVITANYNQLLWEWGITLHWKLQDVRPSLNSLQQGFLSKCFQFRSTAVLHCRPEVPVIKIDDFHEHLNRQNADIQFTKEIEENGKIPFLDCLVTRDNNKLQTTIYRKPAHADRLLDQSSYNPTSNKATTIRTLTRRAQLVCDWPDSLQDETDYLNNVFSKNNYNT